VAVSNSFRDEIFVTKDSLRNIDGAAPGEERAISREGGGDQPVKAAAISP
jgi:hypothetical protein